MFKLLHGSVLQAPPLSDRLGVDPMTLRKCPQALLTILYCSTDCRCRAGAPMYNLAHSASFHSCMDNAPSNSGTKHVDAKVGEGLVTIQILGRNAMEEPWSLLGKGREEASSSAISLRQRPIRMIRIEADRRLGDFAAVPAVRFGIESPEIAFVTSGKQPFTLAVDHPDAADVYLPIGDIASANPSRIPEASIIDAAIRTLTLSTISAGSAP